MLNTRQRLRLPKEAAFTTPVITILKLFQEKFTLILFYKDVIVTPGMEKSQLKNKQKYIDVCNKIVQSNNNNKLLKSFFFVYLFL